MFRFKLSLRNMSLLRSTLFSSRLGAFLRVAHFSGPYPSHLVCVTVSKNSIFQSNTLFINSNCREQMLISLLHLTLSPRSWTLLSIYLATIYPDQNCVLVSIAVEVSWQTSLTG